MTDYDVVVIGAGPVGENVADRAVRGGLAARGADARCGVDVVSVVRPQPGGPVTLTLDDQTTVEADEVLAATGREPHTDDLGLETVVDYELGAVAGAKLFEDGYSGKARMVVDEDRKTMIGATLAGPGVGEMTHAATVAVAGQVPLHVLWHAVPSYPTMSEVWLRLLEAYGL